MQELDKKFYKIGDVSEILGIPESTLRYWESQFTIIKPKRNKKNIRYYTPHDIEMISRVYYLVKEKGLKLDAAQPATTVTVLTSVSTPLPSSSPSGNNWSSSKTPWMSSSPTFQPSNKAIKSYND